MAILVITGDDELFATRPSWTLAFFHGIMQEGLQEAIADGRISDDTLTSEQLLQKHYVRIQTFLEDAIASGELRTYMQDDPNAATVKIIKDLENDLLEVETRPRFRVTPVFKDGTRGTPQHPRVKTERVHREAALALVEKYSLPIARRFNPNATTKPMAGPGPLDNYVFRRTGDFWEIVFAGDALAPVKHLKGLEFISELITQFGRNIECLTLASDGTGTLESSSGSTFEKEEIARLKQQFRQVESDIAEGGNVLELAELQEQRDALFQELSVKSFHGRPRKDAGDPAEKARKAVQKNITSAIEKLGTYHKGLAAHLKEYIETGEVCTYKATGISWTTR